jgi:hypothetical protein
MHDATRREGHVVDGGMPECIEVPCSTCGSQTRRCNGCHHMQVVSIMREIEPMLILMMMMMMMMMMMLQCFHGRREEAKRQSWKAGKWHRRRANLDNSLHVRSKVAWIGTLHNALVRLLGFFEGRTDHNVWGKGLERRKPRRVTSLHPSSDWHPVPDLRACLVQFPSHYPYLPHSLPLSSSPSLLPFLSFLPSILPSFSLSDSLLNTYRERHTDLLSPSLSLSLSPSLPLSLSLSYTQKLYLSIYLSIYLRSMLASAPAASCCCCRYPLVLDARFLESGPHFTCILVRWGATDVARGACTDERVIV